jgi:hypothetical protein
VHNISIALEPNGGQALIPLLVERSGPATVPHEGEQSGAPMGALAVTPPKPALYRNSRASKDARSFLTGAFSDEARSLVNKFVKSVPF